MRSVSHCERADSKYPARPIRRADVGGPCPGFLPFWRWIYPKDAVEAAREAGPVAFSVRGKKGSKAATNGAPSPFRSITDLGRKPAAPSAFNFRSFFCDRPDSTTTGICFVD